MLNLHLTLCVCARMWEGAPSMPVDTCLSRPRPLSCLPTLPQPREGRASGSATPVGSGRVSRAQGADLSLFAAVK